MKVVVDTNIIFSAILSSSGKIGQILIFGRKKIDFYAPNLVKIEVKRYKDKLVRLGELTDEDFESTREDIFECLNFISEEQIPFDYWRNAIPFVRDTDMDDIAFVVLSDYLNAFLWTGDKKLLKGLERMGFEKGITTEALHSLIQNTDIM